MRYSFNDQVAIVTGAAGGIGSAVSKRFLSEGARVVLLDLPTSRVLSFAKELDETEKRVMAVAADVTRQEDVRGAVHEAKERFGSVDILINNAGIAPKSPFLELDMATFDKVMAVNVRGSFLMALECAREMVGQCRGSIVQIASTCAFSAGASRNLSAYNMSKAAVRQMVPSLAAELAHLGVRVNAVAPGTIDTEMTRACIPDEESVAGALGKIPLRRFGEPEDIAATCAFLCSPDAAYITGQTVIVDGGWLIS